MQVAHVPQRLMRAFLALRLALRFLAWRRFFLFLLSSLSLSDEDELELDESLLSLLLSLSSLEEDEDDDDDELRLRFLFFLSLLMSFVVSSAASFVFSSCWSKSLIRTVLTSGAMDRSCAMARTVAASPGLALATSNAIRST